MNAAREVRIKRLRLRCWRRGTREMDLILGWFADAVLPGLDPDRLAALEALMSENDQDLYQWITGQCSIPPEHQEIVWRIRNHHRIG